jgi:hypothetical protein
MDNLQKQSRRVDRAIARKLEVKRNIHFFLNHTEVSTFAIAEHLGVKEEEIERTI